MMKNIFFKSFSISGAPRAKRSESRAQSLVEFAIALPVLMLLLLGMVEFGFMLNTYLSIQDAARATARRYSTINPFNPDDTVNMDYFEGAALNVVDTLAPPEDPAARQISMDPTRDNVLISLISVKVDEAPDPNTITDISRLPEGFSHYKLYDDTDPPTNFSDGVIVSQLTANSADPTNSGLLIVEVYYGYEGVLNLPFTTPFMSETNPVTLYASAIMPTTYVKPLRTP